MSQGEAARPHPNTGLSRDPASGGLEAAVMRASEREGEENPPVPDILFRMPIKDNVTCKIGKLLPARGAGPRPTPTPLPLSGCRPGALPGCPQGPRPPEHRRWARGHSLPRGGQRQGPICRPAPLSSLHPLSEPPGPPSALCQAGGRGCAGADPRACCSW